MREWCVFYYNRLLDKVEFSWFVIVRSGLFLFCFCMLLFVHSQASKESAVQMLFD